MKKIVCDTLVVGGGLGGLSSAILLKEKGVDVCLVANKVLGGSSFYEGTWGLGVILARDKKDILVEEIMEVGDNVPNRDLVKTFVYNMEHGYQNLKRWGVTMTYPTNDLDDTYIPCFGSKHYTWRGFTKEGAREALLKQLEGVPTYNHTKLLKLYTTNNRVSSALCIQKDEYIMFYFNHCVLATGGMSNLFKRSISYRDNISNALGCAIDVGAKVVNLEFNQLMLALGKVAPLTIFNEKVYHYLRIDDDFSFDFTKACNAHRLHGPFTSNRFSKHLEMFYQKNLEKDIWGYFDKSIHDDQSEFVKVYFDWLKKEKNLTKDDKFDLVLSYHASNGGLLIDEHGRCTVDGLYACGEVTGGMHGSDRIGGLSAINALTFSHLICEYIGKNQQQYDKNDVEYAPFTIKNGNEIINELQTLNQQWAMVNRSKSKSENMLQYLSKIQLIESKNEDFGLGYIVLMMIKVSTKLHEAIITRNKSLGSHHILSENENE